MESRLVGRLAGPIPSRSAAGRQTCLWTGSFPYLGSLPKWLKLLRDSYTNCDGGGKCGHSPRPPLDPAAVGFRTSLFNGECQVRTPTRLQSRNATDAIARDRFSVFI